MNKLFQILQETWKEEVALSSGKPQQEHNYAAKEKQLLRTGAIRGFFQETLIITRPRQDPTISGGPGQQNGTRMVFIYGECAIKEE